MSCCWSGRTAKCFAEEKKMSSIIWPILIGLAWRDFGWRADALTLCLFLAFNRNCWQAVLITVCCRPICPLHFARYQHGEWPVERLSFACCCFCEGQWLKLTGWDAVLSVQEGWLQSGAVVLSSVFSFCFHSDLTWTTLCSLWNLWLPVNGLSAGGFALSFPAAVFYQTATITSAVFAIGRLQISDSAVSLWSVHCGIGSLT